MGKGWTKKNILLLAAILGLITGVIVYANMKERPKVQTTVAAVAIARGELIADEMVTTKALGITAKEAVAVESVVGKIARIEFAQGEQIKLTQLAPKGLSARVPDGMRAVSVGVDAVSNVGGFAQPGDKVDVVATYTRGERAYSETLLQNVELLAVGPAANAGEGEKAEPDRKTATLIVTPDQAQAVTLAESQGKLRLILRNPKDITHEPLEETPSKTPVVVRETRQAATAQANPTSNSVRGGLAPAMIGSFSTTTEIVPEDRPTVEVIRGNVKTVEVVSE